MKRPKKTKQPFLARLAGLLDVMLGMGLFFVLILVARATS